MMLSSVYVKTSRTTFSTASYKLFYSDFLAAEQTGIYKRELILRIKNEGEVQ